MEVEDIMDIMNHAKKGKIIITFKKFCTSLYKELNLLIEEQKTDETNNLFDVAVIYNVTHAPFSTSNIIQTHIPHNQQDSAMRFTTHLY
jgi:hypothetical protein